MTNDRDTAFSERYSKEMWEKGIDYYAARLAEFAVPGGVLLDLGCGPCQWAAAALCHGMKVTACDLNITPAAVVLANSNQNLKLVRTDSEYMPFEDDAFDSVLCELVLPYVNVERSLTEIARVLRCGGIVHGICHGPGYYLMQWCSELLQRKKKPRRRMIVLIYTLVHRMCGFKEYRYETFQSVNQIKNILLRLSFSQISIQRGGHPTILKSRFAGLPCFFEFTARSSKTGALVRKQADGP
jgi:ubiquinone/menaquinone biosynthesis C-methylase UbiE